ncbi:MAG: TM2 domain-containing protein [Akkermansia sp.]|nr:TM2 domain-containing protein [Akkermansia sp.]
MNNTNNMTGPAPQQVIYVQQGKSRAAYIIFALFFGGFGIHDFYAGFAGKGLLKIIISIFGGFSLLTGGMTALASAVEPGMEGAKEMAAASAFGILLLCMQVIYIWIQICTQTRDSKGVPFS